MHRIFEEYLHQLELAADKRQFREAMKKFAAQFGLHSYAYVTLPQSTKIRMRAIATYAPDWIAHYFHHHYHESDPILLEARSATASFVWKSQPDASRHSTAVKRFFDEASGFGICYGYTVPIREGCIPVAALTFAAARQTREYCNCIQAHALLLDLATRCFHNQIRLKLNRPRVLNRAGLTFREEQCLELAIAGKSAVDIGHILAISPRTVVFHIENAKAKYDVRSITQAAIAFRADKEGRSSE